MWHLNYNIHDLLKIRICSNEWIGLGRKLKWLFFEDEEYIDEPDIILNIGKFKPENNGCDIIAHKYHVKENYFYCKDKGKETKWELEIIGFEEGQTTVNFDGKDSGIKGILFPSFFAQEFLIPLLEYKLAKKNHFLIHAGAISKNSNGYIFAGRPGAFKTTIIMDFIRKANFNFLGDDRVIINKGNILSFPRMVFFFEFMLANMLTEECNFFDKVGLFKYFIKKTYQMKLPLIDSSKLKALFFVSRVDRNTINRNKLSLKNGIDKLIANIKAEYVTSTTTTPSGQFYNYVLAYSLIFPDNRIAKHWDVMKNGFDEIFKEVDIVEIELPYEYNLEVFEEILKSVRDVD